MPAPAFELPSMLEAREPPEARGLRRDEVRLMVATRASGEIAHRTFTDLSELLAPGDLLVVNVSATLPAAVGGARQDGSAVRVHFSTRAPKLGEAWRVVEMRSADGARPAHAVAGEVIELSGGARLVLVAPYASGHRLLLARLEPQMPVEAYLGAHGEPIRYGYTTAPRPLQDYQTVYATTFGSAEMPSAGRPFTPELLVALMARGVLVAPITLHCGVSSPERHEPPFPEQYDVPESTARIAAAARAAGGRLIAVGTTVVRALETVTGPDGTIRPGAGWTNLVVTAERGVRSVDGLITGWHEPEASHLQMLEAIGGPDLLRHSYDAALDCGYLWHEFGDSHLLLP